MALGGCQRLGVPGEEAISPAALAGTGRRRKNRLAVWRARLRRCPAVLPLCPIAGGAGCRGRSGSAGAVGQPARRSRGRVAAGDARRYPALIRLPLSLDESAVGL